MGITNELFQSERDETPSCQFATVPNDVTRRASARSAPSRTSPTSSASWRRRRRRPARPRRLATRSAAAAASSTSVGCALCHTPTLKTGNTTVAALRNQNVNLFSDLALHDMGPGLADDILQGAARGDEFRTAPLWGLGQRHLLPARRPHDRPRGGDPGAPERWQLEVRAVGGQRGDRQVQRLDERRQAGPAELPALALTLAPDPGRGCPRPGLFFPGPGRSQS